MTRRKKGTGGISEHRGRFRVRGPKNYQSWGCYDTREEAEAVLAQHAVITRAPWTPLSRPMWAGVYFVISGERVKIGRAKNIADRIGSLRTGSPFPLELIAWIETKDYEVEESKQHLLWRQWRAHGEWYEFKGELRKFLIAANRKLSEQWA